MYIQKPHSINTFVEYIFQLRQFFLHLVLLCLVLSFRSNLESWVGQFKMNHTPISRYKRVLFFEMNLSFLSNLFQLRVMINILYTLVNIVNSDNFHFLILPICSPFLEIFFAFNCFDSGIRRHANQNETNQ